MKRKRLLIATGIGFLFGLLGLAQASGLFEWMPETIFFPLHAPALFLAGLFIHGEQVLMLVPLTIVVQWTVVGAVAGFIWHAMYASKHSA